MVLKVIYTKSGYSFYAIKTIKFYIFVKGESLYDYFCWF
jgi:hypothetical protein